MAAIRKHLTIAEDEALNDLRTIYLFTWNPKDSFAQCDDPTSKWDTMICRILKHFKRCMSYYAIVPEFSDQGRLHCHGWFIIKDKIKWVKSVLPLVKRSGFMKMNKMRSSKAFEYMKKELEETQSILHDSLLPFTHNTHDKILQQMFIKYNIIDDPEKVKSRNIYDYLDII